jgi:hypothetical protein
VSTGKDEVRMAVVSKEAPYVCVTRTYFCGDSVQTKLPGLSVGETSTSVAKAL